MNDGTTAAVIVAIKAYILSIRIFLKTSRVFTVSASTSTANDLAYLARKIHVVIHNSVLLPLRAEDGCTISKLADELDEVVSKRSMCERIGSIISSRARHNTEELRYGAKRLVQIMRRVSMPYE